MMWKRAKHINASEWRKAVACQCELMSRCLEHHNTETKLRCPLTTFTNIMMFTGTDLCHMNDFLDFVMCSRSAQRISINSQQVHIVHITRAVGENPVETGWLFLDCISISLSLPGDCIIKRKAGNWWHEICTMPLGVTNKAAEMKEKKKQGVYRLYNPVGLSISATTCCCEVWIVQ